MRDLSDMRAESCGLSGLEERDEERENCRFSKTGGREKHEKQGIE